MPPNGFTSVSLDDATIDQLDAIQAALGDECTSRADAVAKAADAFDTEADA